MKKIFFFLLALSFLPIASATPLFSDVPLSHPFFEAISVLRQRGVVQGFSDGTFAPEKHVSRAAALKILLLSAGIEVSGVAIQNPFPDVPKHEWFAPFVKKARDMGIVRGDGEGNFVPSRNVSRAEALAMLFRIKGDTPDAPQEQPFADVPTYAWYAGYFALAKKKHLLSGELAEPDHMLTRGELADLTYRFFRDDWNESASRGLASYYADFFEGRTTASGETFSQSDFTAAHRTLPFGTRVRVTNVDTLASVVVRITDRGPYAEGKIIDLSKAAFSAIAPLSRGVVPVEISEVPASTPLGKPKECDVDKSTQVIEKNFYPDIVFLHPIPKQVRKNEVLLISGVVTKKPTPSYVSVFYGTGTEKQLFRGVVTNNTFSIPVVFPQTGTFRFSVLAGDSSYAEASTISVVEPECEGEQYKESLPPKHISTRTENGNAVVLWEKNGNNLFRLQFSQGEQETELFVFGKNSVVLPPRLFSAFSEGIATLTIWGSTADGGALYRTTSWKKAEPVTVFLVQHVSRHDNIEPYVQLSPDFMPGETVSFSGTATHPVSSTGLLIDPNENIREIPVHVSGNTFSGSFTPDIPGTYTLEINRTDGIALFVGATHLRGTLPVLPDYFDLHTAPPEKTDIPGDAHKLLLRLTNRDRTARNLPSVVLDDALTDLAQFRADDMCKQGYFSHVDRDGKTANDYRALYNVQTPVSENIVKDIGIVRSYERLMRSAAHRKNIIDPRHRRVGFGLCHPEDEPHLIVMVQIFGGEPFSLDALPRIREDILAEVNSARISQPIVPSVTLESVAQQWANTMAENNIFSFTNGDDSLEKSLRNAGVTQVASGMVFRVRSISDIEYQFSQPQITIADTPQENFLLDTDFAKMGVGIAQNDFWDIYVVVIAAE